MKVKNALMVFVLLVIPLSASAESDELRLRELLGEFLAGASVNDPAIHGQFWDEDLVYTSSGGHRMGKPDIMQNLPEQADARAEVIYSAKDVNVRVFGHTAVVTFRLLAAPASGEGEVLQFYNTGTFFKRHKQWKAVAWQATRIPAAP